MTDNQPYFPPQPEDYTPVDLFDIPASQKRLAQPTPLRPYNGFVLLGLFLALAAVAIPGLTGLAFLFTRSVLWWLVFPIGLLSAGALALPAWFCLGIGAYNLSFIGFEKGRALGWLALILSLVAMAFGIFSAFVIFSHLNALVVGVQALVKNLEALSA